MWGPCKQRWSPWLSFSPAVISDPRVTALAGSSNSVSEEEDKITPFFLICQQGFSHTRGRKAWFHSLPSPTATSQPICGSYDPGNKLRNGCWSQESQEDLDLLAPFAGGLQDHYLSQVLYANSSKQIVCLEWDVKLHKKLHLVWGGQENQLKHNSQGYCAAVVSVVGLNAREPGSTPAFDSWNSHGLEKVTTFQPHLPVKGLLAEHRRTVKNLQTWNCVLEAW